MALNPLELYPIPGTFARASAGVRLREACSVSQFQLSIAPSKSDTSRLEYELHGEIRVSRVRIRGEGVAASCCARLLEQAGFQTVVESANRPKVPAVMLSDATQHLLQEVFERQDLFADFPKIDKRVVAWGNDARPVTLPHSSVVVSEQKLLDRIRPPSPKEAIGDKSETGWTILSARPLPEASAEHQFGSRIATASEVKLKSGYDPHACWIESIEDGWLFLLPSGNEGAWLLSVGGSPDRLLGVSRLVADQIMEVHEPRGQFPAHPRVADPLCGEGWLACGTAALGFDPLCGDGTGNAVREAILGAAAVRAVSTGADVTAVLAHYRARLVGGLKRHLEICEEFYAGGHRGDWWGEQVTSSRRGLEWCTHQLAGVPAARYRLNGFVLEAISPTRLETT